VLTIVYRLRIIVVPDPGRHIKYYLHSHDNDDHRR